MERNLKGVIDERAGRFMDEDIIYFRRRAAEERSAVSASRDLRVRRVHLELAHRYECAVRDILAHRRIHPVRLLQAV